MKKVLYITNIEVPYRTEFFNQLSQKCELTILYEREKSFNRNEIWTKSVNSYKFDKEYLKGIKIHNEFGFDLKILKYIFSKKYDKIIIGCYNSPIQIFAIMIMRLFRIKYILNLDGDYSFEGKSIKNKIKKFILNGADKYLVAGEVATKKLRKILPKANIKPYHFSSLTAMELKQNARLKQRNINNKVLVVGQYYEYKGLDIALNCARVLDNITFLFIGAGNRSEILRKKANEMGLRNIEIISFLDKQKLYLDYENCKLLLLPSRKECWGLVINEAASFGCPIISTFGSGAAVEFLHENYSELLANQDDDIDLINKIKYLLKQDKSYFNKYSEYLLNMSKKYSIEKNVEEFLEIING